MISVKKDTILMGRLVRIVMINLIVLFAQLAQVLKSVLNVTLVTASVLMEPNLKVSVLNVTI